MSVTSSGNPTAQSGSPRASHSFESACLQRSISRSAYAGTCARNFVRRRAACFGRSLVHPDQLEIVLPRLPADWFRRASRRNWTPSSHTDPAATAILPLCSPRLCVLPEVL